MTLAEQDVFYDADDEFYWDSHEHLPPARNGYLKEYLTMEAEALFNQGFFVKGCPLPDGKSCPWYHKFSCEQKMAYLGLLSNPQVLMALLNNQVIWKGEFTARGNPIFCLSQDHRYQFALNEIDYGCEADDLWQTPLKSSENSELQYYSSYQQVRYAYELADAGDDLDLLQEVLKKEFLRFQGVLDKRLPRTQAQDFLHKALVDMTSTFYFFPPNVPNGPTFNPDEFMDQFEELRLVIESQNKNKIELTEELLYRAKEQALEHSSPNCNTSQSNSALRYLLLSNKVVQSAELSPLGHAVFELTGDIPIPFTVSGIKEEEYSVSYAQALKRKSKIEGMLENLFKKAATFLQEYTMPCEAEKDEIIVCMLRCVDFFSQEDEFSNPEEEYFDSIEHIDECEEYFDVVDQLENHEEHANIPQCLLTSSYGFKEGFGFYLKNGICDPSRFEHDSDDNSENENNETQEQKEYRLMGFPIYKETDFTA